MKLGANAKELALAWEKAPAVDIDLTIYNGNDFLTNKGVWDDRLATDVKELVVAAKLKCRLRPRFFLNDASFYPDLKPGIFPQLVDQLRAKLLSSNVDDSDGLDFKNDIQLRDTMHFDPESVEMVVKMFSTPTIQTIRQTHGSIMVDDKTPQRGDQNNSNFVEDEEASKQRSNVETLPEEQTRIKDCLLYTSDAADE